ncbi:MAG: NAD-dependent epimerase/dehydratase family protein [bacterium]|nr:NAD-dependent epimerase/dehydratase family protein [bacterium]
MKIIVTGGAGFIGSNLVDRLIRERHHVAVIDNLSTGSKTNINPKARFYKLDIQSPNIAQVFAKEKPDALFHYAAQIDVRKSWKDPVADARTNILGSLNLLEACRKYGVKKIVFASTGGALYGEASQIPTQETYPTNPISAYGAAKLSVEHYLHAYHVVYGLSVAILRLANVYGPRQDGKGEAGVVAIFSRTLLQGKQPILYGNGTQTRDFVFVEDVVQANLLAFNHKTSGVWNIGTGKETSISLLLKEIQEATGSRKKARTLPLRPGEQKRSCLNMGKARRELGWKPTTTMREGLRKTVQWMEAV